MKIVTSAVIFNEAVGMRLSYSYSEVNEEGTVVKDNIREDKVVTDPKLKKTLQQTLDIAQSFLSDDKEATNE